MRGSAVWGVLVATGLALGGCNQRRTVTPPPPPPPAPAPPPVADGGQLVLMGALGVASSDGGLAGLVGIGKGVPHRERGFYQDWPRSTTTPLPPRPRGLVELPPPPSTADPDALAFDRKLRASKNLIRSCYDRALRAAPALAGEVTLEISLDREGKVLSVATPSSSVGPEVPACLRVLLPRLRFPLPAAGAFKAAVTVKLRPEPPDAGAASP